MIVDRETLDYIKNLGRAIGRFEVRYQIASRERNAAIEQHNHLVEQLIDPPLFDPL